MTTVSPEVIERFDVGDLIEFDFFGKQKRGRIIQIGKYGYWIDDTLGCTGCGSIRCDFDKAVRVEAKGEDKCCKGGPHSGHEYSCHYAFEF